MKFTAVTMNCEKSVEAVVCDLKVVTLFAEMLLLLSRSILIAMFCEDSYGYRPHKSALDAVEKTRKRYWKYDYVIELDVKGLFDNIDHELLMRVVRRHVKEPWICLYIER